MTRDRNAEDRQENTHSNGEVAQRSAPETMVLGKGRSQFTFRPSSSQAKMATEPNAKSDH